MSVSSINEALQGGMIFMHGAGMAAEAAGEKVNDSGFRAMEAQKEQAGALAAGLHEQVQAVHEGLGSLATQLQAGTDQGEHEQKAINECARHVGVGRRGVYDARRELRVALEEPTIEEITQPPIAKLEAATSALIARGDMAIFYTRDFRSAGEEVEAIQTDLNKIIERIAALTSGIATIGEVPSEQATTLHNLQAAPAAIKEAGDAAAAARWKVADILSPIK